MAVASQTSPLAPERLRAARRFERGAHLPFEIEGARVGWLRHGDAALLREWPQVFEFTVDHVALSRQLRDCEARTEALAPVIQALAERGHITGWRDETYAIRNRFDDPPLALIERAAARFFGVLTYAVYANGVVLSEDPQAMPSLWVARRSLSKPTDPGMLDALVGGGVSWGWGIVDALVKEAHEESSVPPQWVAGARKGRVMQLLTEIARGVQAEELYCFDLFLPPDFKPRAEDGEVSEHRLMSVEAVLEVIARGEMALDAEMSTLDCLARGGWLGRADGQGATLERWRDMLDELCKAPSFAELDPD